MDYAAIIAMYENDIRKCQERIVYLRGYIANLRSRQEMEEARGVQR